MPPTKLLVCHCKKIEVTSAATKSFLSTYKDCFSPSLHIPLQSTDPGRQASSKNESEKAILVTLFFHIFNSDFLIGFWDGNKQD